MASRFWVGGTGTWDASDTTHWSDSSGGAGGQSVPGASDTVTLDGSSGGGTVTLGYSPTVTSITMGAFTGTFDAATYSPTMQTFNCSGTGTRTLNMGSGTWTITGNNATVWTTGTSTNLTFNKDTSTVALSYSGSTGTRTVSNGAASAVFYDFNVTAGSDTVVFSTTGPTIRNLDYTGFSGTTSGTNSISLSGNLILGIGMTVPDGAGGFITTGTSGIQTITSNGVTINNLTFNGVGGTIVLADNLSIGSARALILTNGTFNANGKNVTCGNFASSNSNVRTLTMGAGTWTLTGTGTVFTIGTTTNMTFSGASATMVIADTSSTDKSFFAGGGGFTYGTLTVTPGGTGKILFPSVATHTFTALNVTGPKTIQFLSGRTFNFTNWNVNGTNGNPVTINSSTPGSAATISVASGIVESNFVSLQDSTATGGATFRARFSTNVSGNTGWTFTGRQAVSSSLPRLAVRQDDKSVNFVAATDKIDTGTDWIGTGDVTVCGWVKSRSYSGSNLNRLLDNGKFFLYVRANNTIGISSNGVATTISADNSVPFNSWVFFSCTRTSAGTVNFRINGVSSGTANQASGAPAAATTNTFIGNNSIGTKVLDGLISSLATFNRILTTAEQDALYFNNQYPSDYATSIIRDFRFENDTATTVYAYNDISQTGTITGATFSQDTPFKSRDYPGKNLYVSKIGGVGSVGYPGITPTGAAAITGSGGWIEDERFGWYGVRDSASVAIGYDATVLRNGKPTLKFSNTDITGRAHVDTSPATSISPQVLSTFHQTIRVKPNTSYTFSYYYKTNNRTTFSLFGWNYYRADMTRIGVSSANSVGGTNDWTLATNTFTTVSDCVAISPRFQNTNGAIEDNWIDINSLTLTENSFATGQNLVTYSSDISNAAWTKTVSTVSGTDGIVGAASSNTHSIQQTKTYTAGLTYTISASMKAGAQPYSVLGDNNGGHTAWFNLTNGTLGSTTSATSKIMADPSNPGYYICEITFTAIAASDAVRVYAAPSNSVVTYTGDGSTVDVYAKSIQLVQANWRGPRTETTGTATNNGNIRNIVAQQQNILANSQNLSTWSVTGGSITSDTTDTLDPWGTNTAEVLVEDASGATHRMQTVGGAQNILAGSPLTMSVFVKAGTRSTVYIQNSVSESITINLATGGTNSSVGGIARGAVNAGNGWWRIWVTFIATATNSSIYVYAGNPGLSYTGTAGGKALYVTGAQYTRTNWLMPYVQTTTSVLDVGNPRNIVL